MFTYVYITTILYAKDTNCVLQIPHILIIMHSYTQNINCV